MTYPNRNNPYSFDDFLEWRKKLDYYRNDPFLQKTIRHFTEDQFEPVDKAAKEMSPRASGRWRIMADKIARPENAPYVMHYDGHNHRIDRLVRPLETEVMEREVFSEAIFSDDTPKWVRLVKMFLLYQNGEACVSCPLTCTEGLVALLEQYADIPETQNILKHCKEGINGEFAIGAQYLSEIHGGSDVPANLLEAVQEDGQWRLYGTKFFCSATHADYSVVTAKPKDSDKVAIFIVPSWLPGNKEKEIRNGFTIDRIKWKMGTSELPTAELTFNGALGYPVGPLDRGIANVAGIVLSFSRLTVGLSGAASMTRAAREAAGYASFREAFGMPIENFPLVAGQLDAMKRAARRTTAGAFQLYSEVIGLPGGLQGGMSPDADDEEKKRRFNVRELIMLQKITAAWDAVDVLRSAISIFGGHGVMEDFSSLPRLYRDAVVNELWEGPRNVLLTQIYRDLVRAADWYPPADFVRNILSGAPHETVEELAGEAIRLTGYGDIVTLDKEKLEISRQWDQFCHRLFHAYQDTAVFIVESEAR